jgi:hypothetical protein
MGFRRTWLFINAYASLVRAERAIRRDGLVEARAAMVRPWKRRSRTLSPDHPVLAAVDEAIDTAALYYWRTLNCLSRSIAAYQVLRFLGARPVLHIGARTRPFAAHAWTTVSDRVVGEARKDAARGDYVVLETMPSMRATSERRADAGRDPGEPAAVTPSMRIAVAEHVRFAESKGEVVVMDLRGNSVCGIDGPWGVAFLALARGETLGDVAEHVRSLYDVDREVVEAHVGGLVTDLCARGWCTVVP